MRSGGAISAFARAVCDAERRLESPISDLDMIAYVASFGDTSCGFGGFAGQAMTSALVTVIGEPVNDLVVHVGGRFAYHVRRPEGNPPYRHKDELERAWVQRKFASRRLAAKIYGPWIKELG